MLEAADGGREQIEWRLQNAFGVDKLTAALRFSPALRVMVQSRVGAARDILLNLVDSSWYLAQHAEGAEGGVHASPHSVEGAILGPYVGKRVEVKESRTRLYENYRRRLAGKAEQDPDRGQMLARYANFRTAMVDAVTRRTKGTEKPLSENQFNEEIGKMVRHYDPKNPSTHHKIEEINQSAKEYIDAIDWVKGRAVEVGIMTEGAEVSSTSPLFDESIALRDPAREDKAGPHTRNYLTRMYNKGKIAAESPSLSGGETPFVNVISAWLYRTHRPLVDHSISGKKGTGDWEWLYPGMDFEAAAAKHAEEKPPLTQAEAIQVARKIRQSILELEPGRNLTGPIEFGVASPLKRRVLDIDDKAIESWLENDIDVVFDHYMRSMAPDIEIIRKFGRRNEAGELIEGHLYRKNLETLQERWNAERASGNGPTEVGMPGLIRVIWEQQEARVISAYQDLERAGPPETKKLRKAKKGEDREVVKARASKFHAARTKEISKWRQGLDKSLRQDLRDLRWEFDQVRGVKSQMDRYFGPESTPVRAGRILRDLNWMRIGGGFTINSITDVGKPVMVHGLYRTLRSGYAPFITNMKGVKLVGKDLRRFGAATEATLDTRIQAMADITDEYRPTSKPERFVHAAANNFGLITLLSPWNSFWKTLVGVIQHSKIIDIGESLTKGKQWRGMKQDLEDLRQVGLTTDDAMAIWGEVSQHGEYVKNLWVSRTENWADQNLAEKFGMTLRKSVDQTIVTPGVADRVPLLSSEVGKLGGQFKLFQFASLQRTLIPALQKRDMEVFNGIAMSVFAGSLVYIMKQKLNNREINWDPKVLIEEGVDRSGVLGFYGDMHNMLDKATRGTFSANALTGGPVLSRYAGRSMIDALAGPTMGFAHETTSLVGALATGEWTRSDTHRARRMLPYNQVFYWSGIVDAIEAEANRKLQIPERYQKRQTRR